MSARALAGACQVDVIALGSMRDSQEINRWVISTPREYQRQEEASQLPTALLLVDSRLRGNDTNAVPFKQPRC
jgi:hypothetical protein